MSKQIAIRDAYGEALLELGKKNEIIVALEADVGASTKVFSLVRCFLTDILM